MKNYRGTGDRLVVTAAAPYTSGQLIYQDGFVGVAETTVASGARVALRLTGEYEFVTTGWTLTAALAKGTSVYINNTGTLAVTNVAAGAAAPGSTILAGKVTGVPGNPNTGGTTGITNQEPKAGRVWIKLAELQA